MCSRPRNPHRKPKPERPRGLRLVGDGGVVEPEFLEGLPQVGKVVALDGVQPAEHHGLGILVALQGLGRRPAGVGHGLAAAGFADVLDAGDEVADLARAEAATGHVDRRAHPDLLDVMGASRSA